MQISADRLLLIAGGVVFAALLATVRRSALVSMYGIFRAERDRRAIELPRGCDASSAYQLIGDQIVRIAGNSDG